jgi:hypothetical protein
LGKDALVSHFPTTYSFVQSFAATFKNVGGLNGLLSVGELSAVSLLLPLLSIQAAVTFTITCESTQVLRPLPARMASMIQAFFCFIRSLAQLRYVVCDEVAPRTFDRTDGVVVRSRIG